MSDDDIAEIRARHLREDRWCYSPSPQMHADRATLLVEVDRQRAEIERLQDQNKLFRGALDFVAAYRALDFDPQKNLAASHMSSVANEALEGKP